MCHIKNAHLLRNTQVEEDKGQRDQEQDRSLAMSLQDVVDPPRSPPSPLPLTPQQLSDNISSHLIDDISIPITAEMFDFCDDSDIFTDTLQNSDVTSSPNGCSYEDQNSSYAPNISFPSSIVHNNNIKFSTQNIDTNNFQVDQNISNNTSTTTSSTTTTAATITTPNHHHHHRHNHPTTGLSVIYDSQVDIDTDISASIDFSTPPLAYNFNPTSLTNHGLTQYSISPIDPCLTLPLIGGPCTGLGPVFEDDCLSSIPPFLRLNHPTVSSSSCTFLDTNSMNSFQHGLCNDNSNIFGGNLLMASELHAKEIDFQGDNAGIFCSDQLGRYNSGDFQAFSNENSQLINGATNSAPISSLDDSTYKVGKLSVEQRKEKIHRYMKKRTERNFCKKIKYACRKTLADSRPRVRGRFAKNDEFGEAHKHLNGHHDEDDYDEVAVKEGEDMVDSSDIYAHISGVNSFKCNYQIQSWI